MMNRRDLLTGSAALVAAHALRAQAVAPAQLTLGAPLDIPAVPRDFVGLSYESAQLANPAFFSAENKQLIALFRELSPSGNLRIGGGSSEFTTYSDAPPAGPPPFEVFGPDTSKTEKHGTTTTALAVQNLRAFLDATGWNCLYGLNLGQGTVENAVREATAVQRILGPRLLAFQIGNEPDSFRNRYRPATYAPQDFLAEWTKFHNAIVAAVPTAKFAGPDISNKLAYLTAFAEAAPRFKDVILLTSHYYAMGPARDPRATLDNLLSPDPQLTTLKRRDLHIIAEAQQTAHLPYRMSEGNSCWDGGKPGVSDTFASALWCAGYMLECMTRGWTGVNLHGGGNGFYAPIVGAPSTGFTRRPEFFGMLLAARYTGARALSVSAPQLNERVEVFAFERDGHHELIVVNKSAEPVTLGTPQGAREVLRLSAPGIDAKQDVLLAQMSSHRSKTLTVAPYTASVFSTH